MPTRQQAEQFETDGYFIADDAVAPNLFDELAAATRRVKHKVRSGQVDVYTHWATDENTEPWAIRGLLAPEFDEPVFAEYLMSKPVMDYVHHFIGTDLTLGSILLFTNPHHADYSIGWHRDWGKLERDLDYDAEMAILGKPLSELALASCHRRRASAGRRARQPSRGPAALLRPLARPAGAMKLP